MSRQVITPKGISPTSRRLKDSLHERIGKLAFIMDERLPREKNALLSRTVNQMRSFAEIDLFEGNVTEDIFLKELQTSKYTMVLAPWHLYQEWYRVESALGKARVDGPAFAGYFCEQVDPRSISLSYGNSDQIRSIFLDFAYLAPTEIIRLVRSVMDETRRTGIFALLAPQTPVLYDNWLRGDSLGRRLDTILQHPDIEAREWGNRKAAIRNLLCSLWSLIYDDGAGKNESQSALMARTAVAHFQLGIDTHSLVFRLCFSMPLWTPRKSFELFWPNSALPLRPMSPGQQLLRTADFLRVTTIADSNDIELTTGFLKSSPSEIAANSMHTLWIDCLKRELIEEIPFEEPPPSEKRYVALLSSKVGRGSEDTVRKISLPHGASNDGFELVTDPRMQQAVAKIQQMQKQLAQKETLIEELRGGGVGRIETVEQRIEVEGLIDQLQKRYFESRVQIHQLEHRLDVLVNENKARPDLAVIREMDNIQVQIDLNYEKEELWIQKVSTLLDVFRKSRERTDDKKVA